MVRKTSRPGAAKATEPLAQDWVDQALLPLGIERTTPLETIQARPWSRIARCGSSIGDLYFKACEKRFLHEVGVTLLLAGRHADCSPVLLAADAQRGWMLMQDAGLRLRERIREDNWLDLWKRILERYAEMQIDLVSQLDALFAIGVPDRRLSKLADRLEAILGENSLIMLGEPDGLSESQYIQLHDLLPTIRDRCDQLQQANIPASINHGDFHDANIFLRDEQVVFADWGDASVTHPFFSLRTVFVSLENTLGFEENAPIFSHLRDAYLEAWQGFANDQALTDTFELASRLWPLGSLLSWHHSISGWPQEQRHEYRDAIPSLLLELLEANAN